MAESVNFQALQRGLGFAPDPLVLGADNYVGIALSVVGGLKAEVRRAVTDKRLRPEALELAREIPAVNLRWNDLKALAEGLGMKPPFAPMRVVLEVTETVRKLRETLAAALPLASVAFSHAAAATWDAAIDRAFPERVGK
jgi:hypothetical protein